MAASQKILILDDDPEFLEVCKQLLSGLAAKPEILTATTATRALALLESEHFSLLLTDLRMPKMDGYQMLAILHRRHPSQRVVVMTGADDETARTRAYGMGIDLFMEKPKTQKEMDFFLECIESMLELDMNGSGFRGVIEHKTLLDIIQLESLTRSSAVLKITSGKLIGYIWFREGEIIDAATSFSKAETAFKEILSWKVGRFDLLPPDMARTRSIMTSVQGLLLDTAQSMDEDEAMQVNANDPSKGAPLSRLAALGRTEGVEFLLSQSEPREHWSCENVGEVDSWAQRLLSEYAALGDLLCVGKPAWVEGYSAERHIVVAALEKAPLVVGFKATLRPEEVHHGLEEVLIQWDS